LLGGSPERARLALDDAGFEVAYRGALLDGSGKIVVFATPEGGTLGIYRQHDADPLLHVSQCVGATTIEEFALNSVSINRAGQLAVRVLLENGRQLVARTLD
jgi:hypothetical protein